MAASNIFNLALLDLSRQRLEGSTKSAFLPATDQTFGAGDPNAAAGGADPQAAGMDPNAMGGGDPTSGGAAPAAPAGGASGGSSGGMSSADVEAIIQRVVSQMGAGGMGGGAEAPKPKLDVAVEVYRLNRMMARLLDTLGVQMPAEEMIGDVEAIARNPATAATAGTSGFQAGQQASQGGQAGGIQPLSAMPAAQTGGGGQTKSSAYAQAVRDSESLSQRAKAIRKIIASREG